VWGRKKPREKAGRVKAQGISLSNKTPKTWCFRGDDKALPGAMQTVAWRPLPTPQGKDHRTHCSTFSHPDYNRRPRKFAGSCFVPLWATTCSRALPPIGNSRALHVSPCPEGII
jgi:hypothetical protein